MAASDRWRGLLTSAVLNTQAGDPAEYVALLARPGYTVDAWETIYQHVLTDGDNAVVEWVKGTTLRPVLACLDGEQAAAFVREYGERVLEAYRPHSFGTIFPFRRVFAVLHRRGSRTEGDRRA
jgi:trans-aconitate 2-methyltransferase